MIFTYNFWESLKGQLGFDCVVANVCRTQTPLLPLCANIIYERPLSQHQEFIASYLGIPIAEPYIAACHAKNNSSQSQNGMFIPLQPLIEWCFE